MLRLKAEPECCHLITDEKSKFSTAFHILTQRTKSPSDFLYSTIDDLTIVVGVIEYLCIETEQPVLVKHY